MAKEPQDKNEDGEEAKGPAKGIVGRILAPFAKIFGLALGPFRAIFGKLLGNKKILIGTAAALVLLLGGAGYFLFSGSPAPEQRENAAAEGEKKEAAHAATEEAKPEDQTNMPQFVDLPEMTINLVSTTGKPQFLRVRVTLEISDAMTAQKIQPVMPRVLDIFQVYMRELRVADIEGSAGIQRLKEELTKRVNQVVTPAHIEGVLFKDMLVQ
jgi:flagellar FliL protein